MNADRLRYLHELLVKAAVQKQGLELPVWKFDGTEVLTVKDAALVLGAPLEEVMCLIEQKDVTSASGAGIATIGVGTRLLHAGICRRANALAYRNRRRRRHQKENEEK